MTQLIEAAIALIYECALDPALWPSALQRVADCFEDVGCILLYGRDDGSFGVVQSPSLDELVQLYSAGWSTRDIRAIRSRERGYFLRRDVITDRDVLTDAEMQRDPFYTEFLSRAGLKYFAAAMVSPDPHIEVALSVQRAAGKAEYTEEELTRLSVLGQHVERALRLSIRLLDNEISKAGLALALSRVGVGVFILDSLGRVRFSNDAAVRLVGDGVEIVGEQLRIRAPFSEQSTSSAFTASPLDLFEDYQPLLQIQRQRSPRPLTAYLMPASPSQSRAHDFLTHARMIVLLIDPEEGPPDPSLLRDLLGLTLAEAKVAALVGSGIAPRVAAEHLGIAEDTVRKALKRVFAKTGVSRQTELATLMSRLLLKKLN